MPKCDKGKGMVLYCKTAARGVTAQSTVTFRQFCATCSIWFHYPDVMRAPNENMSGILKASWAHCGWDVQNIAVIQGKKLGTVRTVSRSPKSTLLINGRQARIWPNEIFAFLIGEFHSPWETDQNPPQSRCIAPSFLQKCSAHTKWHLDELCEDESLLKVEEHFKVSVLCTAADTAITKVMSRFDSMQEGACPLELSAKSDKSKWKTTASTHIP